MKKLLLILFISLGLIGCASNQLATDGYYYKNVGGNSCVRYDVVTPGRIRCYNKDGAVTYFQNAMSDQEVLLWKLDEMGSQIQQLKYQQILNNNQQIWNNNLNNNYINNCPWWDNYRCW